MNLKIVTNGMTGIGTKIYLDGKELKKVFDAKVKLNVHEANMATISFYPDEIDLVGDFKVARRSSLLQRFLSWFPCAWAEIKFWLKLRLGRL